MQFLFLLFYTTVMSSNNLNECNNYNKTIQYINKSQIVN